MSSILIQVEHLREGDLIDIGPILIERHSLGLLDDDEFQVSYMTAECEYATVETVTVDHKGYIIVWNNHCSLAFERGTLIELIGDDIRGPIESGN